MKDELSLALSQLASCHLDVQSSKKRNSQILETQNLILSFTENHDIVVNAFLNVVDKCYTTHSKVRITDLILQTIVHKVSRLSGDNLKQLWIAYCRILVGVHNIGECNLTNNNLLSRSISKFDESIRKGRSKESNGKDVVGVLHDTIWDILKCNDQNIGDDGSWAICVSFLTHLVASQFIDNKQDQELCTNQIITEFELMDMFQQFALKQKQFPTHDIMQHCQQFIDYMSRNENELISSSMQALLSTMGLKLRSSPESAFPTVNSIIALFKPTSSSLMVQNEFAANLHDGAKLLPAIMKQITSTKDHLRQLSCKSLVHLSNFPTCFEIIIESIISVMTNGKSGGVLISGVKLTSANHRDALYSTLLNIAISCLKKVDKASLGSYQKVFDKVFDALTSSLMKEVSSSTSKEVGVKSLVTWMIFYKEFKHIENVHGIDLDSYSAAARYLAQPVSDGKKKTTSNSNSSSGNEFRFRLGPLFMNISSVNDRVINEIALDLIKSGKEQNTMMDGLQCIVESSMKKHNNSGLVAQVDGLIATYMLLIHSFERNEKSSFSPFVKTKVLNPGSLGMSDQSSSFLFSTAMLDALRTDVIVNRLLYRTICLASKVLDGLVNLNNEGVPSAAAFSCACCIISPILSVDESPSSQLMSKVLACTKDILLNADKVSRSADALTSAILHQLNKLEMERQNAAEESKVSKNYEEKSDLSLEQSQYGRKFYVNVKSVHDVSYLLLPLVSDSVHMAKTLMLSHYGTTLKTIGKRQRDGLENYVLKMFPKIEACSTSGIANVLVHYITGIKIENDNDDSSVATNSLFNAVLSLIKTLGRIGGNFDVEFNDPDDPEASNYALAWKFCVKELAPKVASSLQSAFEDIQALTLDDMKLYNTLPGLLFVTEAGDGVRSNVSTIKQKKGNEDEEWELQVKEEIAKKRAAEAGIPSSQKLSEAEANQLSSQAIERQRIHDLVYIHFQRCLQTIQCLCLSDIEVGNSILPTVANCVTEAATCKCEAFNILPGITQLSFDTLYNLATCVYEIDEIHSLSIAKALCMCKKEGQGSSYSALPSPCLAAAAVINEMNEHGDCLGFNSFIFLFPIICAALTGPRTTSGCEDVLRVLDRHIELLSHENNVGTLRKDMASAVLELLCHDRSKTFKSPSATECLLKIYNTETKLTPSDISPLLGENGSLGGKNCRLASMYVLAGILEKQQSMIKINPLVENRIWLNCFSLDEDVKKEARNAWNIGHGISSNTVDLASPTKMFAIALTPLLSHKDSTTAKAAAEAYAYAMEKHNDTSRKNLTLLFKAYIASYPTVVQDNIYQTPTAPSLSQPAASSKASTLVSSKATTKTSKLTVGTAKVTKKKKATGTSAIAALTTTKKKTTKKRSDGPITLTLTKPKERTFDQKLLNAQFESSKDEEKKAEKDDEHRTRVREGVLRVLAASAKNKLKLEVNTFKLLVVFLLAYGLADVNPSVKVMATNTLRDIAASDLAKGAIDFLLPLLEECLKHGKVDTTYLEELPEDKVFETTVASDCRKEGVVIALGAAAIHLDNEKDVAKIDEICDMLINALTTPSESVQSSVALCVSKLMKKGRMSDRTESLLLQLMDECLHGNTLASQRGSAYGISAVVKGSGIACLKKFEIVTRLEEVCSFGSSKEKEGALFAIELLSNQLGLLFEPYVIVLLPSLLRSFSDGSIHVRSAANSSVGLVMSKLSGHGVKLLMPAVLTALESEDWRTKQASIHMLGTMSHCAPKQLASCLPRLVPKLTESFSDTHPKVKKSAQEALEQISKVIRNPEIAEISTALLQALVDPAHSTLDALESLIETEFLHSIDAASLSLIVPVLHRGLRDRAATTKRYAALIAGNICTMINEPKDFVPYLPILVPDLKGVLLDPIPDCRSISAKALGSLTRSLGEATFPELRPWLIDTLKSESGTSVERSGAAQGLTEVICAGGAGLVENVMKDEILPLISHPNPAYREGVLWVLTFLPSSLGQAFATLIDSSFPALISGLSDEIEPVRDVAMRAARVTIRSHGKANVDMILPTLEQSLSNEDYRIRAASLNLLGDLLSCIGGSKISKNDGDTQDDIRQAERAQAQIALILGPEIRKRVLSSLYLRRSDTTAIVRQSAVQVWKSVVSVTPRTLKEILDGLVGQIVTALASGHPDHTQVAGRCLGDIVSKLGDAVLPEIIPVLRDAIDRGDIHTRLGACVGLNEVIICLSKEQIDKYLSILVKAVRDVLCDSLDQVRDMAALCFQSLYSMVGNKVLDEVIPWLLVGMESTANDDSTQKKSINGLTSILKIRSRELLPYLIPRLLRKPISVNQATALGSIFTVTGDSIHVFISSIIPTFLTELVELSTNESNENDKKKEEALRDCLTSLCRSVEETGVHLLVSEIAGKCSSDKIAMRKECCWLFQVLIEQRKDKHDFYEGIPIILRELLYRLNDNSELVLKSSNVALSSLSKHVPAEILVNHIEFIRNLIASMVSESRRRKGGVGDGEFFLPGFNMPKGLEPLLPIYQRGILYGSSSIREISALGLGELVTITASKYLAGPFIIKLTGPLLRIVGDRNPSSVKVAIIQTLGLILNKGGPSLRAFVPQFQTTFSKALSDPSRLVRVEAIKALGLLMPLSTRVDPLLKELISSVSGSGVIKDLESTGALAIQTASIEALATVLKYGGQKAKLPDTIPSALNASKECLFHNDDGLRLGAAKAIAAACDLLPPSTANDLAIEILETELSSPEIKHGLAAFCRFMLSSKVGSELSTDIIDSMKDITIAQMKEESILVKEMYCTVAAILLGIAKNNDSFTKQIEKSLLLCMNTKESMEILKGIAKGLCIAVQLNPQLFDGNKNIAFIDAALDNAMCGNQRVQLAYNDFLWLALHVDEGDIGLSKYCDVVMFERAKKMKSLYSKVLIKMKGVQIDE